MTKLFKSNLNDASLITPSCFFDREFCKSVFYSDVYKNSFFIVHQNIRSLRKNFDLFLIHLESFVNKPKIIFLTEIWIYEHEKDFFTIPGFNFYAKCNNTYTSGGTAVFIDENLFCDFFSTNLISSDMLEISVVINSIKMIFMCFYRFHNVNVEIFIEELNSLLINNNSKYLFILGDINLDLMSDSLVVEKYRSLFSAYGLISCINVPTRITLSSKTCIDHILARIDIKTNLTLTSTVSDFKISDHCMTGLFFNFKENSQFIMRKSVFHKQYTLTNFDLLNSKLVFENWSRAYIDNELSIAFDIFVLVLNGYVNQCSKVIDNRKVKLKKLKPWMSNFLLNKIHYKNQLRLKCKKHPNNVVLRANYNLLCKEINLEIPICKESFYMTKFHKAKGDLKKEWSIVNELFNKNNNLDFPSNLTFGNVNIVGFSEMAKIFNEYFTQIAINTISDAGINCSSVYCNEHCFNEVFQPNSFFFETISSLEVYKVIQALDNSFSSTSNSYSNNFVKKISFNIVDILAYLYNKSITHGVFPPSLKIAEVIPIFKKGD